MNKEIDIAISEKYVGTPAPDDTEDVEDRVEGALEQLKRHLVLRPLPPTTLANHADPANSALLTTPITFIAADRLRRKANLMRIIRTIPSRIGKTESTA